MSHAAPRWIGLVVTRLVFKRLAAEFDLEEIAVLIGRHRPRTALRFLAAAEKTCQLLSHFPQLGAVHPSLPPPFATYGFIEQTLSNNFGAYRPTADGIEVVRVIHGARDLSSIFKA